MTVIESLSKGVPVIASTAGAVPEILDVPGRHGVSPYGAACDTLEEYEAALNASLTRPKEKSLAIQAYARAKYDSHVVVNDLLQFSLDVGSHVGVMPTYPVRDWHAMLEEEALWQHTRGMGLLERLLAGRSRAGSTWYRIGVVLHVVCAVAVAAGSRPCKKVWRGKEEGEDD